jgi:uncharacterized protein
MLDLVNLQQLKEILQKTKTIAIVGLSPKTARPSNMVGRYLLENGFKVIPVNPGQDEILGLKCYPSLKDIQQHVDMVNIFRRSEDVLPIVADAVSIGAKTVWMQEGIVNEEAAGYARKAGLQVVMDRCVKVDHAQLLIP